MYQKRKLYSLSQRVKDILNNPVLENIKQFNNAHESLGPFLKKYKKLITE